MNTQLNPDLVRAKMRELFTAEDKLNVDKLIGMGEFEQAGSVVQVETPEQEEILQAYLDLLRPKVNPEGSQVRKEMDEAIARGEDISTPEQEAYWQKRLDEEAAALEEGKKEAAETVVADDSMTKKEIMEALDAAGVDYDPTLKKAELLEVLEASKRGAAEPMEALESSDAESTDTE